MATTPTITGNTPLIPSRTRSTRIGSNSCCIDSGIVEALNSIQKSVKKIELVVASGFTIQKKQIDQQRRESLAKNRAKKEKESENIKLVNPFKFLQGALPRTGFLDALKNFILYTFMGLAFTKLYPLLPKLLVMAKGVKPFAKFLENFVGAVFNNFVGAIDLGYKQYDKVRALAKQIGGEKYEKQFDDLSSALNKFLNTAIIVGLAIAGSGAVGGGGGKKLPTKISPRPGVGAPGKSKRLGEFFNQTRAQEKITQKYGFDAARLYQDKINKGLSPAKALEAVKQRFTQRAIPTGNLAGKGRTPGRIGARGLGNVSNRAALKLFGKGGTKILGKVPIVGPIIDFLISTLIFKERPDRAASGAVGAAVGAALGSFPALLPFGGPIWGGLLGDIIGRSLFDAVSSMPNDKVQKKAKGGPVTRGGRPIGKPRRTAPKIQKRLKRNKPQEPKAGKDIGGIKIIRKIYRSPKNIKPGKPNPLKTLEAISKINSKNKDPLFGGIIAATSNLTIGQKPDPSLKQEIKNNFATLIDNAISAQSAKDASQIGKSILAAANGGTIQPPVTRTLKSGPTIGERLGDLIATSFQKSLNVRTNEIFNSIRRQLGIKDDEDIPSQTPFGDVPEAEISENQRKAADDLVKYYTKIYGKNAAIGIVANLLRESGLRTYAPEGGFNGMAQWDDNRWAKLVAWANAKGKDPMSRSTQAEYIVVELNELGTGNRLKNTKTPEEAASLFYNEFERAAYSKPIKGNAYNPDNPHERKNKSFILALTGGKGSGPEAMVTGGIKPSQIPQTSGQGWRWGKIHKGVDLDGGDGANISSAQNGKVVWAGDKGDDYGNSVVIRYSNGAETRFGHLKSFNVKTGQEIKAGQLIGKQGNTGSSTASHLHFEYYPNGGALSYEGYGNAASVKDSYFRYGGNVKPKILAKPAGLTKPSGKVTGYGKVDGSEYFYANGKYWERKNGGTKEINSRDYAAIRTNFPTNFGISPAVDANKLQLPGGGYRPKSDYTSSSKPSSSTTIAKLQTPKENLAQQVAKASQEDPTNTQKTNTVYLYQKIYMQA